MFVKLRRVGSFAVLAALMLLLLAACGKGDGVVSATPEDRVKNFFNDISAAFNDPKLSEAATQDEWATKLSMYFLPSDQAKQKAEMKTSLTEMSAGGATSGTLKIEGITTEKVSESGDNAEVKITGGKMTVSALGQTEELDLATQNPFTTNGNPKLKKENGVWYIVDDSADGQ